MTLAEACALAQRIARDERAPFRVEKIETWDWPTYAVNVSLMGQPTAGVWIASEQQWNEFAASVRVG